MVEDIVSRKEVMVGEMFNCSAGRTKPGDTTYQIFIDVGEIFLEFTTLTIWHNNHFKSNIGEAPDLGVELTGLPCAGKKLAGFFERSRESGPRVLKALPPSPQ